MGFFLVFFIKTVFKKKQLFVGSNHVQCTCISHFIIKNYTKPWTVMSGNLYGVQQDFPIQFQKGLLKTISLLAGIMNLWLGQRALDARTVHVDYCCILTIYMGLWVHKIIGQGSIFSTKMVNWATKFLFWRPKFKSGGQHDHQHTCNWGWRPEILDNFPSLIRF